MYREIKEGSIQIQEGLWLFENEFKVGDATYINKEYVAEEGYCFYNKKEEIYQDLEENGTAVLLNENEIKDTQRTLMRYLKAPLSYNNTDLVSIKLTEELKPLLVN